LQQSKLSTRRAQTDSQLGGIREVATVCLVIDRGRRRGVLREAS